MDLSRLQASAKQAITALTPSEQEQLRSSLGPQQLQALSTLALLKKISELVSRERFQAVVQACIPRFECSWKVNTAVAGNRTYARWGCSATLVDNKVYLFGGRGKDNRTRGSMHILETNPVCFTQLKTLSAPEPRDGHTCVYYDGKLILFGGCEGGDDETQHFNRVHSLDLSTRTWSDLPILGSSPQGRDGHAAAQIDDVMVIYGGKSASGLCSDVIGFHVPKGTWHTYVMEGDAPGPRESMSCTTIGSSLYIFGGNVNPAEQEKDIYSNELYRLDVGAKVVRSQLLRPLTGSPPARLSCSLSALTHFMLVIFGGECETGLLNDVWIYHLNLGVWSEVTPPKPIDSRIAHIGVAMSGKLIVFGGLAENNLALNEVSTLTFRLSESEADTADTSSPVASFSAPPRRSKHCENCGHMQSLCTMERFPGFSFPKFSHLTGVRVHRGMLESVLEDRDTVTSFLNLLRLFSGFPIAIKCVQSPPKSDDSAPLGNGSGQIRVFLECNSLVSFASSMVLSPQKLAGLVSGNTKDNILADLMALSSTVLLVSRTDEFLSVCLVSSSQNCQYILQHFLLYSDSLHLIYPIAEVAKKTLDLLHNEFKMSQQDLFFLSTGLHISFHSKHIIPQLNETLLMTHCGHLCLERLLEGFYYREQQACPISINDISLSFSFAKDRSCAAKRKTEKCVFRHLKVEDHWLFEVRIYHDNRLIYVKMKDEERVHKRKRGAARLPCDIILRDDSLMRDSKSGWTRSLEVLDLLWEDDDETPPRKMNGTTDSF